MIRLYGTVKGNGSWPRVTAGVHEGLAACGKLTSFYDVERIDMDYADDGDALDDGYDAPVGLCIGAPPSASVMMGRGQHRERLLSVFPNSSWLSETMMEQAAKICTGFVVASHWGCKVVAEYACGLPVYRYAVGVDQRFTPAPHAEVSGSFLALHLASTHMQRKGTRELIEGWALAMRRKYIPPEARLRLVVDGPRGYFDSAIHEATQGDIAMADTYLVQRRLNLGVEDMATLYRQHHFVVQPSRGEGWGMVPVEARACGVPVIATACTSHADHIALMDMGVVVVEHGPDAEVDDGPGALAPSVSPEAVADALSIAYAHRDALSVEAQACADDIREKWSWKAVTERFLEQFEV